MMSITAFIDSGILDQYILGLANEQEQAEVEQMASKHLEVRNVLDEISEAFETGLMAAAMQPPVMLKPMLMAVLDYLSRIEKGEAISFPPPLTQNSSITDYSFWLDRPEMIVPADFSEVHATVIGHSENMTTAIVWLQHGTLPEIHYYEHERFLIVEGACTIMIDGQTQDMVPGDFIAIPLFKSHRLHVTSTFPCKVILQKSAA